MGVHLLSVYRRAAHVPGLDTIDYHNVHLLFFSCTANSNPMQFACRVLTSMDHGLMGGALGHVTSARASIGVARRESRVVLGDVAAPVEVGSCVEVIETPRLFAMTAVDHTWVSRLDRWIQDNL